MPSRFVRVEVIKAEEGSITGLSAYVRREARVDLEGARFNFRHRADELVDCGIVLPERAPEWAEDGERLWREATAAELVKDRETGEIRFRKNAQVAKHMVIALPIEATDAERADMVRRWIGEELRPQEHQVAVEWAIHRDEGNPHAHILISTRALGPGGFGKKARGMNPEFSSRGKLHFISEQDGWDERWAAFQERYFAEHRIKAQVRDRRPVQEPHMGTKRFVRPEIEDEVKKVRAVNDEFVTAAARDPSEVLVALTKRKAVFTETDLRRYCARHQIFGQEREALLEAVHGHAETLELYDGQGKRAGYTTRHVRRQEEGVLTLAARFAQMRAQGVRAHLDRSGLSIEQELAARSMSGEARFALLIGRAGTGKTHTLNPVRHAYEAAGFEVVGLAPTNTVAADLRAAGFQQAATLHRELRAVESRRRRWGSRTVVIVDEAAMVDSDTMARLFQAVAESGAILRLAGDDRQFESVARGGLFSELVRRHGAVELREVRRQPEAWQARASEQYAAGNIHTALAAYAARGAVQFTETHEEARQALLAAVAADERAAPEKMRFIYASTNEEVDKLNAARQANLRAGKAAMGPQGAVASKGQSFETVRGKVDIAAGERVQFYATDHKIGLFTAEFGTVRLVQKDRIEVEKDNGQRIAFDPRQFSGWGLGYAGTVYKGQGKTQPETYALYDHPYAWDSRAAYVTGTRHVDQTRLFVSRQLAPDLATLAAQITRPREYRGVSMRFEARAPVAAPSPAQMSARFQDVLDQSAKARAAEKARQEAEAARQKAEAAERAAAEQARQQQAVRREPQRSQHQGPKAGSTYRPSGSPSP